MGWMYMIVCICDFVIFPVLWSVAQVMGTNGEVTSQWRPITLEGAGLFHIALGAILGVAAWGRTQEKMIGFHSLRANHEQSYAQTRKSPALDEEPEL